MLMVMKMKKTLTLMIVSVLLGSLCGKGLYDSYANSQNVFNQNEKIYVLQEGVYSNLESLNRNTKDINPKVIVKENNQYYVYIGISKSLNQIKKIKKVYNKKGYSTYQKEIDINDKEFLVNLEQYDLLLDSAKTSDDILAIQEVVLSNYESLSKK